MWWAELLNNLVAQLGTGAGAAASSFESIATLTAAGGETSLTFSSIPSTYQHLQIRGISRRNAAGSTYIGLRVNGISTSTYIWHHLYGDGTSAQTASGTTTSYINGPRQATATDAANIFGSFVVDLTDYASSTKNKTFRMFGGYDANGSGSIYLTSGLFNSTSAITSLTIYYGGDALLAGSTFALYGIKG